MSEIVNKSLQKIAKGTGIIFIGTIIGMLLGFVGRVILVRYITQSEYGIYSLALVIISIFVTISTLGLDLGSTRYIAYFRGKREEENVSGVISSSVQIALIASISLAAISFFISDLVSIKIFQCQALSTPLKIFSIAIPFTVLIHVFIAIFRGFDRVEPSVYFQNILRNILFILFLITVVLFGLSFLDVIHAYVLSIAVTGVAFVMYMIKRPPLPIRWSGVNNTMKKKLLLFSLPLLATTMLGMIMHWTDTLMLGYFKTPDMVGLYNAALPLASLIPVVLTSMRFLYVPIASQLYSQNLMDEIRRNYAVLTKWMFSLTLPLFFIIFLFPETVLNILFGSRYIQADAVLQFLALGMFINTFLGPNGATLMIAGKTKILMWTSLIGSIMNIVLNILLIPPLGIIGAAIASTASLAVINLLNSTWLYLLFRIHPFTKNYIKPIIASIIPAFVIFILAKCLFDVLPVWMLLMLFILFLVMCGLSILLTKSFDDEDIMMLLAIEKRTGINLTFIKRILRRFL